MINISTGSNLSLVTIHSTQVSLEFAVSDYTTMAGKGKKKRNSNDSGSSGSGEKKKGKKKSAKAGKGSKFQCDIFNDAAMDNAYYVCHNVQDILKSRGFPWPEAQKKKKKK